MGSRVDDFQRSTLPEVEQRDEQWFYDQLATKCSQLYVKGKDILIVCPFHADSNPSCGVDRRTGRFRCFACNAGGGWNKLAYRLGIATLKSKRTDKSNDPVTDMVDDVARSLRSLGAQDPARREQEKSRPLVKPWDPGIPWRSVSGSLLSDLGCVDVRDLRKTIKRIGLPIRSHEGNLWGYTCRALDPPDAEPKYEPMSADRYSWREKEIPTREALFLIDRAMAEGWRRVVLVEGPYDALHLYAAGIPAMALLGAANWNATKVALVEGLGFEQVFTMMDQDHAGESATELVVSTLGPNVRTTPIRLPPGVKDPGGLSPKQLDWVKTRIG